MLALAMGDKALEQAFGFVVWQPRKTAFKTDLYLIPISMDCFENCQDPLTPLYFSHVSYAHSHKIELVPNFCAIGMIACQFILNIRRTCVSVCAVLQYTWKFRFFAEN